MEENTPDAAGPAAKIDDTQFEEKSESDSEDIEEVIEAVRA